MGFSGEQFKWPFISSSEFFVFWFLFVCLFLQGMSIGKELMFIRDIHSPSKERYTQAHFLDVETEA